MYARLISLFLSVYIPFFIPSGAMQSGGSQSGQPEIQAFDGTTATFWASNQQGTAISGVAWIGVLYPSNEVVVTGPFFIVLDQCQPAANSLTSVKYQIHTGLGWNSGTAVSVTAGVTTFTANVTGTYDGVRLMADSNLTGSNRWRVCELGLYMKQPDPFVQAPTSTPTMTLTPTITPTPSNTPTPTPNYYIEVTSTRTSPMRLERSASYGDMGITGSICIATAVFAVAFGLWFWRGRR